MVAEYEGEKLDSDTRTELLIVGGGARRDLGDDEAARVLFQKAVRGAFPDGDGTLTLRIG